MMIAPSPSCTHFCYMTSPPLPIGAAHGGPHPPAWLESDDSASVRPQPSSKYDFIKVRVWLGSRQAREHYYVLSRFLISRHLTATKVPPQKAVKIALDVKKLLVDEGRLDVSQEELESELFGLLASRGYGPEHTRRYRLFSSFFQQRRPLIVLIAGTGCTGKSTLAQQLASRLNLPNVLQTDTLAELLRLGGSGLVPPEPLWTRDLGGGGLLAEYANECAAVRRALAGDLDKCMRDGKSLIIEGLHLDPQLYLTEWDEAGTNNGSTAAVLAQPAGQPPGPAAGDHAASRAATGPSSAALAAGAAAAWGRSSAAVVLEERPAAGPQPSPSLRSPRGVQTAERPAACSCSKAGATSDGAAGASAGGACRPHAGRAAQPAQAAPGAVLVPLVLRMAPEQQELLLPGWAGAPRAHGSSNAEGAELRCRLAAVQERLCSARAAGVPVFEVQASGFGAALDALHDYVLRCIQLAVPDEPSP